MSRISVAGGYYRELCSSPCVDEKYGSGGRAAVALALDGVKVDWYYYCPDGEKSNASLILNHENISHRPHDSAALIAFKYFHPLSSPIFIPAEIKREESIEITDDVVLRFGYMEGTAIVNANKCVYDPQSPERPEPFKRNGSTAKSLAIVLNAQEVLKYGASQNEEEAVRNIFATDAAEVVLVKAGCAGCRVYENQKYIGTIPPYWSQKVYKIGTGDIFSAAFTYHWAIQKQPALKAADLASRCVAKYCETRIPNVENNAACQILKPMSNKKKGKIYIAGPFFTMADLWLIEEAYSCLSKLGVDTFSPYHHVGLGPADKVVAADIKGLEECSAVLAIFDGTDPGTVFETGYAVKKGIPVVSFSQNSKETDKTMLLGSPSCSFTDDFATAIYHAVWRAQQ